MAGAALYFDDMMCEFAKQTGMTVSHEAFDIAYRIKGSGRIILTTDCSGLAQTQTEFDHYVRKMKFVKDGDRLRIDHYDGRQEWVNPQRLRGGEGAGAELRGFRPKHGKAHAGGLAGYHAHDQSESGPVYPCG